MLNSMSQAMECSAEHAQLIRCTLQPPWTNCDNPGCSLSPSGLGPVHVIAVQSSRGRCSLRTGRVAACSPHANWAHATMTAARHAPSTRPSRNLCVLWRTSCRNLRRARKLVLRVHQPTTCTSGSPVSVPHYSEVQLTASHGTFFWWLLRLFNTGSIPGSPSLAADQFAEGALRGAL